MGILGLVMLIFYVLLFLYIGHDPRKIDQHKMQSKYELPLFIMSIIILVLLTPILLLLSPLALIPFLWPIFLHLLLPFVIAILYLTRNIQDKRTRKLMITLVWIDIVMIGISWIFAFVGASYFRLNMYKSYLTVPFKSKIVKKKVKKNK